jgi:hypothetical protein
MRRRRLLGGVIWVDLGGVYYDQKFGDFGRQACMVNGKKNKVEASSLDPNEMDDAGGVR